MVLVPPPPSCHAVLYRSRLCLQVRHIEIPEGQELRKLHLLKEELGELSGKRGKRY